MNRIELINKINEALAEEFEVEVSTLAPNAVIKDALDIDSLGLVDMVALVEGLFGVKIHAGEIASILTLENLYDYIERKTEKEFI